MKSFSHDANLSASIEQWLNKLDEASKRDGFRIEQVRLIVYDDVLERRRVVDYFNGAWHEYKDM